MSERKDTVQKYFDKVDVVNCIHNILFWTSAILSILIFFSKDLNIESTLNILFILVTILYFTFSSFLSVFLIRHAQDKRRTNFLTDSLGIKLDDEITNEYYNNSQIPSLTRLGVNAFENSLFTMRTSEKMLIKERLKVGIYILLWLILTLVRNTDIYLIAIIGQTLFTSGILIHWLKLEVLSYSCNRIFNDFRQLFISSDINNKENQAIILKLVFQYETVKANMGVHMSSKIFFRINKQVSDEWERIKANVGLK